MDNDHATAETEQPDHWAKEEPFHPFGRQSPDWRLILGGCFTVIWVAVLAYYISGSVGWLQMSDIRIGTMGSFLEGAFAPLAFLWFVLGYFSQQKELSLNTDAIKMQYVEIQRSAEQAVMQTEAIKASEFHARRESFLRIAENVKVQLGVIMGFLFVSSQGAASEGIVSQQRISELWHNMGQNDPELFSRQMMEFQFRHGERYAYKLLYGTIIRTTHSKNFIFNFERLLATAEECDTNGMIRDAIRGSAHGFIYQRMLNYRDNPPAGFTYGVYNFDPDSND
ncbi:MAG: hypothetical protein ABGY96_13290 [bacterium]|nr:hypothetical protein [Gammaproteobacteria bacterium]HIL94646.1 hypothetical protein [Pseudomonadales bacterium]